MRNVFFVMIGIMDLRSRELRFNVYKLSENKCSSPRYHREGVSLNLFLLNLFWVFSLLFFPFFHSFCLLSFFSFACVTDQDSVIRIAGPSRLAPRPTQPPAQWLLGLSFQGVKWTGRGADRPSPYSAGLRMGRAIGLPLPLLSSCLACNGTAVHHVSWEGTSWN